LDWTSADTLRNIPPWTPLNDIYLAINERCKAAGITPLNFTLRNSHRNGWQMQDKLTDLIPFFANHTDNSGAWDGQASIPVWTESDLETEISESRPTVERCAPLTAEWVWWMHECLNLLLWTKISLSFTNIVDDHFRQVGAGTWAGVISGWTPPGTGSNITRFSGQSYYGYNWYATRAYGKMQITQPTTDLWCAIDWYCTPYTGYPPDIWDDESRGFNQSTLSKVYTSTSEYATTRQSGYIGEGSGVPPMDASGDKTGWEIVVYAAILKWDVAFGFTYQP